MKTRHLRLSADLTRGSHVKTAFNFEEDLTLMFGALLIELVLI